MTEKNKGAQTDRKAWLQPQLKRISAGSAEAGNNLSPDSGPVGTAQS